MPLKILMVQKVFVIATRRIPERFSPWCAIKRRRIRKINDLQTGQAARIPKDLKKKSM
jgi:hypothetical protein